MATIIEGVGGSSNSAPIVTDLQVVGKIDTDRVVISWKVADKEQQIVRQFLILNDVKSDITKDVGYDKPSYEYTILNLKSGTDYTIQIVASDGISEGSQTIKIKTPDLIKWGIEIDETNSNPGGAVKYIGANRDFTPARGSDWGSWKDKFPFNKIKPCGFKAGKKVAYLQEMDFGLYENGATINHGDTDTMVEFPKVYWKFTRVGSTLRIEIADKKADDDFICPAHTIGVKEVDNIYIGVYEGSEQGGKLRSVPNQVPLVSKTISQFRQYAQAQGKGYQQFCYYPMLMLQILFLIMYKARDSQSALGVGYTNDSSGVHNTGTTTTKGMLYGESTGKEAVKFLGIEDLWGNVYDLVDGIFIKNNKLYISNLDTFNDTAEGYSDFGNVSIERGAKYITKVMGNSNAGFFPSLLNASSSTYYCDIGASTNNCVPGVGGNYSDRELAGIFFINTGITASRAFPFVGSRLIYLGGE